MLKLEKGQLIEITEPVTLQVKNTGGSEEFDKGNFLFLIEKYCDERNVNICVFVSPKTLNFIEWSEQGLENYNYDGKKFKLL